MNNIPEHLMVIEYETALQQKIAMFNSTVISKEDVEYFIKHGLLDDEYNPNVVVMTKRQYRNLFDSNNDAVTIGSENTDHTFYTDLRLEQQGGIN